MNKQTDGPFSTSLENIFTKPQGNYFSNADNLPCDLIDPALTPFLGRTLALQSVSNVQNGVVDIEIFMQSTFYLPSKTLR